MEKNSLEKILEKELEKLKVKYVHANLVVEKYIIDKQKENSYALIENYYINSISEIFGKYFKLKNNSVKKSTKKVGFMEKS